METESHMRFVYLCKDLMSTFYKNILYLSEYQVPEIHPNDPIKFTVIKIPSTLGIPILMMEE